MTRPGDPGFPTFIPKRARDDRRDPTALVIKPYVQGQEAAVHAGGRLRVRRRRHAVRTPASELREAMNLEPLDHAIETERFVLRPLGEAHLDGLFAVHGDAEATRFIPSPTWQTRDDAVAWLSRNTTMHDEGKTRRWAIVEKGSERPIGDCMLFSFDEHSARAEIGFVLGRRDWGRGAMREAAGGLITAAFEDLGLRRIEAFADVRNVASDRLLRSLGFVHEGRLRRRSTIKDQIVDSNVYGLLRDEWVGGRS